MKSRMPPQAYISQEWFQHERELLFKPLWQFAGLKMMLAQPNSFITRTIGGIPVVIQNFNGELRAFENLCAHRQNPLQTQAHGVRSLVCSYHGWKYDSDGNVENMPYEHEVFRYEKQERECLGLKRFKLETIGNLVFVNLAADPLPLNTQFNQSLIDQLEEVSNAFDSEVLFTTYKAKLNWKLAYENLRDSHHPRYLHSRSLYQNVRFQVAMDETAISEAKHYRKEGTQHHQQALGILAGFSSGGPDEPMKAKESYAWHDYVERYGDKDWYYNWLLFPNLHIASGSGGYSFIIEHHQPVSAGCTDVMVYYVTAKKKRPYATSAAVLHAHLMGADTVLREDFEVMENIQAALHEHAPHAALGDFEYGNSVIQDWYMDVMEGKITL